MFTEDVRLRDWEINVQGKQAVLDANKNIFQAAQELTVEIERIHVSPAACACEIKIGINGNILLVTDIIEFKDNKICAVRAYRG